MSTRPARRKENWRPQWDIEGRQPTFIADGETLVMFGGLKYLWGNVPAFDVLKIKENEGQDYNEDLMLCFAASGDARNVIYSVAGLPEMYGGACTCIINDKDEDVVQRNILILLTAISRPPEEATELILHLWYSARLTKILEERFRESVRPRIADVVEKIKLKKNGVLQSKTWSYGTSSVTVCLTKGQWGALLNLLDAQHDSSKAEHQRLEIVLNASRTDHLERHLLNLQPSLRLASVHFRESGVLLPFGACVDAYDKPNPTLFSKSDAWKQPDSADPLNSWSSNFVTGSCQHRIIPNYDCYGQLYFGLLELFKRFCAKIDTHKVRFRLYELDAVELPALLDKEKSGFDRIEVSNIADRCYLGPQRTLQTFAPLLKSPVLNSHAVLVTLFMNACHEMKSEADEIAAMRDTIQQAACFLNVAAPQSALRQWSPMMIQLMGAKDLFRDYDVLFRRYMEAFQFGRLGREVGLSMRVPEDHRIIDAWPLRLKKRFGEPGAKEEFDQRIGSGAVGSERYVEWVKVLE
ncbi:MAG: hypothetical protein M1835_003794 [Candelina submexicana]|nr:MAG: hypothetical protein M1835_003794 [Candelina submexicana]